MCQKSKQGFCVAVFLAVIGCSFARQQVRAEEKDINPLQTIQTLTVFDANGKRVGNVITLFGTYASVAFRIRGEIVVLGVSSVQFEGTNGLAERNSSLTFESANCTGMPFYPRSNPFPPGLAPFHILDGSKLYTVDGPPRTAIIRSTGSTSFPGVCGPIGSFQATQLPLRFLIDLATQFQPPFTLK